ncbi:MAG: aldo/keto reductase [Dehalococcoidales bacterium]|nr:aldo/keto reductase [Dehalococcoidales bacterium]
MIYKQLANTGEKIPAIGQGTRGAGSSAAATPKSIQQRIDVLRCGIELGMTFLDMAENYEAGNTERIVGKAIRGIRDKVFLSTKFKPSCCSYDEIMQSLEGSLCRLKTEYVDLYQVHWPNPNAHILEVLHTLEKILRQGKARYIGVGNFNSEQYQLWSGLTFEKLVSNQIEYNLIDRDAESSFIPTSEERQVTVIAYSPFDQGNMLFSEMERQILKSIASDYDKTVHQIILNWIISHPTVVTIPQSMSFQHTQKNAEAADFTLSDSDIKLIDNTFTPEIKLVPTDRIRVLNYDVDDSHPIYTTLEEAQKNRFNLCPGPMDIAREIIAGHKLKPVRLVEREDGYYNLVRGRVRYWGWVMVWENTKPIPAIVRGD